MAIPILSLLVSPQPLRMKSQNKVKVTTAVMLMLSAVVIPLSQKDKNPCRVEIEYPHISSYFVKNSGFNAVKVNAYSVCDRPHSRVSVTVELWKEEALFKKRIKKTIARHVGLLTPNEKFYNQKTFVRCKSSKKTLYFGVAYAKALIVGKWHFAAHKLDISIPVDCGT